MSDNTFIFVVIGACVFAQILGALIDYLIGKKFGYQHQQKYRFPIICSVVAISLFLPITVFDFSDVIG